MLVLFIGICASACVLTIYDMYNSKSETERQQDILDIFYNSQTIPDNPMNIFIIDRRLGGCVSTLAEMNRIYMELYDIIEQGVPADLREVQLLNVRMEKLNLMLDGLAVHDSEYLRACRKSIVRMIQESYLD
jgi:hypothetical protein